MDNKEKVKQMIWEIGFALLGVLTSKTFWAGMGTAAGYHQATGDLTGYLVAIVGYMAKNVSADFGKEKAKIEKLPISE